VFPGGFGTLDELFEALSLIQTGRVEPFPVILLGKAYWKGMLRWMEKVPLKKGALDESDLNIFSVVDSPSDVLRSIQDFYSPATAP